jgi:recombination protein U
MSETNYANRGKSLEILIEHANEQYKSKGVALIQKVWTPWKVTWAGGKVTSAFPAQKSTVDYIGIEGDQRHSTPIAFDAKQCKLKTNFPLANIEQHQVDFLWDWQARGGASFLLIEMTVLGKIYRVETDEIMRRWLNKSIGGPKSIPIKDFTKFKEVGQAGGCVLDYLELYTKNQ